MEIIKKPIAYNFNKGGNSKQYIVIHDTGNRKIGADAMNHYNYFNGGDRQSSAHYFVDANIILQVVDDNDKSWHCGKKYGIAPMPQINNSNSIGIETCVDEGNDYYKAFNNTVELTKYLMKKYNIKKDNVVRHYDACLKMCPSSMFDNNWAKWQQFLSLLDSPNVTTVQSPTPISNPINTIVTTPVIINVDSKDYTFSTIKYNNNNYIKLRDFEQLGYSITYDTTTNKATMTHK